MDNIREYFYEVYKRDWINTHISNERYIGTMNEYYKEKKDNIDYPDFPSFKDYIEENGFDFGEIYCSYDEFLDFEYQQKNYWKSLINDEEIYGEYLEDLEILKEENVKDDDMLMVIVGHKEKKEFETKLNEFLKENEDMLLKNHVFFRNSLQVVPHIINVIIPNLNEKIDEYNNDFDGQFLPVTPIVNKNSQNSFTINFTAQNKQVTYDFDEMYNKLVNFKDNYDLESDMAKELGLYDFVTSIEDELYTERDKAIDSLKEEYYR